MTELIPEFFPSEITDPVVTAAVEHLKETKPRTIQVDYCNACADWKDPSVVHDSVALIDLIARQLRGQPLPRHIVNRDVALVFQEICKRVTVDGSYDISTRPSGVDSDITVLTLKTGPG